MCNTRGWQDYWHWRDKPVGERGAAKEVLEAAGVEITDMRSRDNDPPDCEAFLDGKWSGIEVSELVHQPTLEQSIRAKKERAAGKNPKLPEAFINWPPDYLLAAIQTRIDEKDVAHLNEYKRYVLVLVTAEIYLYKAHVEPILEGAQFRARSITDVFFGLDYHAADPVTEEGGGIPVFQLCLTPRSSKSNLDPSTVGGRC